MRKILFLSVCMIFFTGVAFAGSSAEVLLKVGVAPSSQINNNPTNDNAKRYDGDPGFSLSPEVYYYFMDNLGIGIGYNQLFNRNIKDRGDLIASNFYVALRPKFKVLENEYVYIIGQAGYGLMNHNFVVNGEELDNGSGFYYGVGGGVDIHNFIFELLFTSNKATLKSMVSEYEENDEYTLMTINIGYRFSVLTSKEKEDTEE